MSEAIPSTADIGDPARARAKKKPAEWYRINIALADDQEPKRLFIGGCDEGDFEIERGRDVDVPEGVIERLKHAVKGVAEKDPNDDTKLVVVQRQRFSYTVLQRLGPRVAGKFPEAAKYAIPA